MAMLAIAILIVAVAVVVVPGSGDDDPAPVAQSSTETETVEVTGSTTSTDAETTTTEAQLKPKPKPPLLTAAEPRELEYKKGDTISFRVRHTADDEIHVHGFDKSKDVKANETVTMSFRANIEGIFEVELEHSGTPLGTLKVEPK
jgi:plastocyanin